jgi:hypothetical protein
MAKILALLAIAALAPSCSTCSDGYKTNPLGGGILVPATYYSACSQKCVTKGKECRCSKQCPCWDKHGVQRPPAPK